MGFLANVANAVTGGLMDIGVNAANAAVNAHYSKSLMAYQSRLNRHDLEYQLTKSPSFSRTGLVDAGYNPILAFSSNSANMGHVSPASVSGGSSSAGRNFIASMEAENAKIKLQQEKEYNENTLDLQKQEIENKEAQTDILKAQAEEAKRKNLVSEELLKQSQDETKRSNLATETETNRANISREVLEKEKNDIAGFHSVVGAYNDYVRSTASEYSGDVKIPGVFKGSGKWKDIPEDDMTKFMLQYLSNKYGFTPTPKPKWINDSPYGVKMPLEHKFYPQKRERNYYK